MIALQYTRTGEPVEVVAPVDVPQPAPQPGEVRLRMLRSPIHNHDLATIRGQYGMRPPLPATGGTEFLGTVDALGAGVASFEPGQRVAGQLAAGAWAEYAVAPAGSLVPIPAALADDDAAQLLAMPLSAIVLFDELHVKPGEWIVQNAASGTVARILCRLAQRAGIGVVNLVRRASAVGELTGFGAEHVVVTDDDGWPQRVRDMVGSAPIARVVDSVCDAQSIALNRLLGEFGEHVVFGALAGAALKLDPGAVIFGETTVRGFWMTAWMKRASQERRASAIARLFSLALAGELPLPVAGVYPLRDAKAALAAAEAPGRSGKILLSPA